MGKNLGLPHTFVAPSGVEVNVVTPVGGRRYSCGPFETKFKTMERGVKAASSNALEAAPAVEDVVRDSEDVPDTSCDGLLTPELVTYAN